MLNLVKERFVELHRMGLWLYVSLALLAVVAWLSWPTITMIVKVAAKVTTGAWLGYWLDRAAFRGARVHEPLQVATDDSQPDEHRRIMFLLSLGYMLRRAIVIGACITAFALGV
jgi:hypothetical protein